MRDRKGPLMFQFEQRLLGKWDCGVSRVKIKSIWPIVGCGEGEGRAEWLQAGMETTVVAVSYDGWGEVEWEQTLADGTQTTLHFLYKLG